jgi:hypothetical protein
VIVLSVLDVVPPHDFDLAEVGILLPLRADSREAGGRRQTRDECTYVEEVDLFEEFLLVMLELPDHGVRAKERPTFLSRLNIISCHVVLSSLSSADYRRPATRNR